MNEGVGHGPNGLSYSFILFLLAAGFSLTFGVMGVLNLSHGALFVLGAYIGLQVIETLNSFWLAVVIAAIALAVVGLMLYFFFLRHLYNKVPEQAVLTIGIAYIIANVILWIWGPRAQIAQTPEFLTGALKVGGLSFPIYRIFISGVGLVVLGLLWWMQDRTRWGAIIRAGMDNKEMTTGLGVNYGLVSTLVFLLGVALAGLAGVLAAPDPGGIPFHGGQPSAADAHRRGRRRHRLYPGHDVGSARHRAPGYVRQGLYP